MNQHPSPYMYRYWLIEWHDRTVQREVIQGDPAKDAKVKQLVGLKWVEWVKTTPLLFDATLTTNIGNHVDVSVS